MRYVKQLTGLAALAVAVTSLGCIADQRRSPTFLVVDSLTGKSGGGAGDFGVPVSSDVITGVTSPAPCSPTSICYTTFNDLGQVRLRAESKAATSPTDPTPHGDVTITHYRVVFRLASGGGVPGVDVPAPFDGATTGTVPIGGNATLPFELVPITIKYASPVSGLLGGGVIQSIAEVTFYGTDQGGEEITATGLLQVNFANWGNP